MARRKPKPEILFYVDDGVDRYLPYPGAFPTGSKTVAQRIVDVNPGWKLCPMKVHPYVGECEE